MAIIFHISRREIIPRKTNGFELTSVRISKALNEVGLALSTLFANISRRLSTVSNGPF